MHGYKDRENEKNEDDMMKTQLDINHCNVIKFKNALGSC